LKNIFEGFKTKYLIKLKPKIESNNTFELNNNSLKRRFHILAALHGSYKEAFQYLE